MHALTYPTGQYSRLVHRWVDSIGLESISKGGHSTTDKSVRGGKLNDDLAEMVAFFQKVQCLRHSIESNCAVNYRLHVIALNSEGHLFEHSPAADRQTDHVQILPEQARDCDLLREARQHANHQDRPTNPRGFDDCCNVSLPPTSTM
jgi:hypothetical protein